MKKNTIRALKDAGHDDKLGVITFGPEFLHDPDLIEWMHHCVLAFDEDGEGFKRDPSFKQLVDDFASRLLFAFKHRAEEDATASVHSFVRALEAVLRREVNTAGHADDVWQEFGENRKQRTTTLNEVLQYSDFIIQRLEFRKHKSGECSAISRFPGAQTDQADADKAELRARFRMLYLFR